MHRIVIGTIFGTLIAGTVFAQTFTLPDPGMTPEHPLYFLDLWEEQFRLIFVFDETVRVERRLAIAEERLAEAQALAGRGIVAVQRALEFYEQGMLLAYAEADTANNPAMFELIIARATLHLPVLDNISERTPFDEKQFVVFTKQFVIDDQMSAVRHLMDTDVNRAFALFGEALRGRFERVRNVARDEENIQEALREYEKYALAGARFLTIVGEKTETKYVRESMRRIALEYLPVFSSEVRAKITPQAEAMFDRAVQATRALLASGGGDIIFPSPQINPGSVPVPDFIQTPSASAPPNIDTNKNPNTSTTTNTNINTATTTVHDASLSPPPPPSPM